MTRVAGLTVRVAMPDDADAVTAVLGASYPALLAADYDPDLLARALPLMCRANPRLLESGTYYVAEREDVIVGCGGWTREPPGGGPAEPAEGHVRHFATHPSAIRSGVGAAMLRRCFEDAAVAGIGLLHCNATRPAVPFYAAAGFARIRPIDVVLRDGIVFPSILMQAAVA